MTTAGAIRLPATAELDTIVELGPGRLAPDLVAVAGALRDRIGERLAAGDGLTVAAVAGGTGVGKSALVNALVGTPVAREGVRRPTTDHALALRRDAGPDSDQLLDWLDVPDRREVGDELPEGLVLLDLPDHDSVATEHRRSSARLAERVDVLLWVLDPVKYSRADSHHGPLAALTAHADVLRFVLNRTDELGPDDRSRLLDDLRARLLDAGHQDVAVLTTSARTGDGVHELRDELADLATRRRAALARLAADAKALGRRIATQLDDVPDLDPDRPRLLDALLDASDSARVVDDAERVYRRDAVRIAASPLARLARLPFRVARGAATGLGLRSDAGPATPRTTSRRVEGSVARDLLPADTAGHVHGALQRELSAGVAAATPELRAAVDGLGVRPPRRTWWRAAMIAGAATEAVAVAGLAWLTALAVVAYLQLPPLPTPDAIGAVPWPTALLLGGVAARVLVWLTTRTAIRIGGRRHGRRLRTQLRRRVGEVLDARILTPLDAELARLRELHRAVRNLAV
jgi:hypothetical protein